MGGGDERRRRRLGEHELLEGDVHQLQLLQLGQWPVERGSRLLVVEARAWHAASTTVTHADARHDTATSSSSSCNGWSPDEIVSVCTSAGSASISACSCGPAESETVLGKTRRWSEASSGFVVCSPAKHHCGPSVRGSPSSILPAVLVHGVRMLNEFWHAPQPYDWRIPSGPEHMPRSCRRCTGCGTRHFEPGAHGLPQRVHLRKEPTTSAASLPILSASNDAGSPPSALSSTRFARLTATSSPLARATAKRLVCGLHEVTVPAIPLRSDRPLRSRNVTSAPTSSASRLHSSQSCASVLVPSAIASVARS